MFFQLYINQLYINLCGVGGLMLQFLKVVGVGGGQGSCACLHVCLKICLGDVSACHEGCLYGVFVQVAGYGADCLPN